MATSSQADATGGLPMRVLLATVMALAFVAAISVPSARADLTWNVYSQGWCSDSAYGDSTLNWSGATANDVGKSWGYLWYWSDQWILKSQGYMEHRGDQGWATANPSATKVNGSWIETGAHQATFFSGTATSESSIFTCQ